MIVFKNARKSGESKVVEEICMSMTKVYPYGRAEGCYILIPDFGDYNLKTNTGGAADIQEIFNFEVGKKYRISVEEIGDFTEEVTKFNKQYGGNIQVEGL